MTATPSPLPAMDMSREKVLERRGFLKDWLLQVAPYNSLLDGALCFYSPTTFEVKITKNVALTRAFERLFHEGFMRQTKGDLSKQEVTRLVEYFFVAMFRLSREQAPTFKATDLKHYRKFTKMLRAFNEFRHLLQKAEANDNLHDETWKAVTRKLEQFHQGMNDVKNFFNSKSCLVNGK